MAESELPKTKNNSAEGNTASSSMAHPNPIAMAPQGWPKTEAQAKEEAGCGLSALRSAVGSGEADDGVFTSCTSFTSKVDWDELRGD